MFRMNVTPQIEVVADDVDVAIRLNDRAVLRVTETEAVGLGKVLVLAGLTLAIRRVQPVLERIGYARLAAGVGRDC